MYQPESYAIALAFMIVTMLCWGSWANTLKLAPGYRFQLFYWDYVLGLFAGALFWGLTLGSMGPSSGTVGLPFLADLSHAGSQNILWAIVGGIDFNIANLLLVAAIDIAGLAVAFPIGIGIALVVGAVSSYLLAPKGNPLMLFAGVALVTAAIICDAAAYRARESSAPQKVTTRGIVLSLIAGLLMGTFYPFVSRAMQGEGAPGPYAISFLFVCGVALCAIPVNYLFMRRPLDGKAPVSMAGYFQAKPSWHLWGILGGIIWCTGATLNFVASRTGVVGPAVSYSIGQGATMISAAWGVFIWREFAAAPVKSKRLLFWMFVLFLLGLTLVALAPLY
jgi:glucose uptake protein